MCVTCVSPNLNIIYEVWDYGYTKVKYRFLKVTLSKYGLILIKIPIDLNILFLIYCICSVHHFNLSSIIMPKNLVLLTSSIALFLIEIFSVLEFILVLQKKPCNVFYRYLMSICSPVATHQAYSIQY